MAILNQYRYYCNTEAANVEEWRDDTQGAPTQCATDSAHTIDTNTIAIIASVNTDEHPAVDADRGRAIKAKPHIHRDDLKYGLECLYFKLKTVSPVRVTDWDPRNWSTTLSSDAASAATSLVCNSVKHFAKFMTITLDRGNANEEDVVITDIDVSTKTLTLNAGTVNAHLTDVTVDIDRVQVTESGGVTTTDFIIGSQNTDPLLAGADTKGAKAYIDSVIGTANGDTIKAELIVPVAVGAEVVGGVLAEVRTVAGMNPLPVDAEGGATTIDPNYILRITMTMATAGWCSILLDVWRA